MTEMDSHTLQKNDVAPSQNSCSCTIFKTLFAQNDHIKGFVYYNGKSNYFYSYLQPC